MQAITIIVTLLVLPCALAQWGVPEEGVCPEITTMEDFDMHKYEGRWYDIRHNEWSFGTEANTCQTSDIVHSDHGSAEPADVYNSEVFYVMGESVNIQTEAMIFETEVSGALWVYYGEGEPDSIGVPNHNVLATDYETYACVFNCVQVDDTTREVFSFLMGRNNILTEDEAATCDTIFTDLGLSRDTTIESVHGDDCYYFPEP